VRADCPAPPSQVLTPPRPALMPCAAWPSSGTLPVRTVAVRQQVCALDDAPNQPVHAHEPRRQHLLRLRGVRKPTPTPQPTPSPARTRTDNRPVRHVCDSTRGPKPRRRCSPTPAAPNCSVMGGPDDMAGTGCIWSAALMFGWLPGALPSASLRDLSWTVDEACGRGACPAPPSCRNACSNTNEL
jgi:hypothetical protein